MRGRHGHELILWIMKLKLYEGRDAQENVMFYPQKRPLTNQIHLENEQNSHVIHYMGTIEQLSTSTNSHAKMCKPQ